MQEAHDATSIFKGVRTEFTGDVLTGQIMYWRKMGVNWRFRSRFYPFEYVGDLLKSGGRSFRNEIIDLVSHPSREHQPRRMAVIIPMAFVIHVKRTGVINHRFQKRFFARILTGALFRFRFLNYLLCCFILSQVEEYLFDTAGIVSRVTGVDLRQDGANECFGLMQPRLESLDILRGGISSSVRGFIISAVYLIRDGKLAIR